jgi:hypothetical protein
MPVNVSGTNANPNWSSLSNFNILHDTPHSAYFQDNLTIGADGVATPGIIRNMGSPLTGMLGHYVGTGTISAVLPISSATSVLAPLVLSGIVVGGYVRDAMGSMAGIRVEHNLHTHAFTGPPTPPMVGTLV